MTKGQQHADPNHLNPTQALEYVRRLGMTDAQIENAERQGYPMPGVEFRELKPFPLVVYHRGDLENWVKRWGD